jgi:hypothetical protein
MYCVEMINMSRKNVGRPVCSSLCLFTFYIKIGLNMMQINRQWMNADGRSPEYIAGMQAFLEVAKANKNPKGFMCCPCSLCRNNKDYSADWGTLHLHLIKNGFMANYVLWTTHGERGVVMEENEDEEDDNNIPVWAAGQDFVDTLMEDADE